MKLFRKQKTNREFISTRQEIKETARFTLRDLLGGSVLSKEVVTRQIPFLLFGAIIILSYIMNQYRGENIMRQISKLEKRLREMHTESVSTAFELQELSKQSEVSEMIIDEGLPLQEAKTPPYKIEMDE
jgi:cell division protein FtsL